MKLSIGIVGLPNVGKSTLFKALTKNEVHIANYPFATIDPNVGIVPVPDERLEKLAALSHSKKIIPAVIEFYDIAGLVKGANTGEGLGNQFLAHIRETQAIVIVLRTFQNPEIIHVEQTVNPIRDLEIINTELALKDLDTVNKRLNSLESKVKRGEKSALKNLEILKSVKTELEKGNLIHQFSGEEIIKELQLLTSKKQIYFLNGTKEDLKDEILAKIKNLAGDYVVGDLSGNIDAGELIKKSYQILDLISFLTTGEDETRAWTIKKGAKAPEAAGVIHTDFENKFIRAEVINWQKLLEANDWNKAKQKGWIRLEGKEYIVVDGDVLVIRHG